MVGVCSPAERFYRVLQLREELERLSSLLLGRNPAALGPVSQPTPRLAPAELGFLRSITYLYVLYFEVGRVAVKFLSSLLEGYSLDADSSARNHFAHVDRLRTYLQHNLDGSKASDSRTMAICESWIKNRCGTSLPADETQWEACLCGILEDASLSLERLLACVRNIETDEAKDIHLARWIFELDRHHTPEQFDPVVAEAAADMGVPFMDVQRFRQRHYEGWLARLRAFSGSYDFKYEARRLVEETMLADAAAMMPVTGADLIEVIGIRPGPEVRAALEIAKRLFRAKPCPRNELLALVQQELSNISPSTLG